MIKAKIPVLTIISRTVAELLCHIVVSGLIEIISADYTLMFPVKNKKHAEYHAAKVSEVGDAVGS